MSCALPRVLISLHYRCGLPELFWLHHISELFHELVPIFPSTLRLRKRSPAQDATESLQSHKHPTGYFMGRNTRPPRTGAATDARPQRERRSRSYNSVSLYANYSGRHRLASLFNSRSQPSGPPPVRSDATSATPDPPTERIQSTDRSSRTTATDPLRATGPTTSAIGMDPPRVPGVPTEAQCRPDASPLPDMDPHSAPGVPSQADDRPDVSCPRQPCVSSQTDDRPDASCPPHPPAELIEDAVHDDAGNADDHPDDCDDHAGDCEGITVAEPCGTRENPASFAQPEEDVRAQQHPPAQGYIDEEDRPRNDDLVFTSDDGTDDDSDSDVSTGEDGRATGPSSSAIRTMRRRICNVLRWDRLLSVMCLDGKTAFTEKQYKYVCMAVKTCRDEISMRTPRAIRRTVRRLLLTHCYPRNRVTYVGENAGCTSDSTFSRSVQPWNTGASSPLDCVRLILPSDWAKMDVLTKPFYDAVYMKTHDNGKAVDVEYTNIVLRRHNVFQTKPALRATFRETACTSYAELGDLLSFPCSRQPIFHAQGICGWVATAEEQQGRTSTYNATIGLVGPTVGVGFESGWGTQSDEKLDLAFPNDFLELEALLLSVVQQPTRNLDGTLSRRVNDRSDASVPDSGFLQTTILGSSGTIMDIPLYPGDTVTSIRPSQHAVSEGVVCVLLASAVSGMLSKPAERLLWVGMDAENGKLKNLVTLTTVNITGLATFAETEAKMDAVCREELKASNMGTLDNGERFVVYRAALYADGFQQNKSSRQSKSVGGVYLLPVGLPMKERTSYHACRVLCLTPHGCSINKAMGMILEDIREAAVHGVQGIDPFGRTVRIFIDTTAFFGDLPQAAAFTDVLGHTANALCTLCYMRRRKGRNVPETNFSNDTHAGRPAFMRFNARQRAIRRHDPHVGVLRALGMKYGENVTMESLPAVRLAQLSDGGSPRSTIKGEPVVPALFDHALGLPVLPDHLMSSMTSNVLTACFKVLDTDDVKSEVELRILKAARDNGFSMKQHIISWERSKRGTRYRGIASNSMSAWFCVLVVASPIFRDVHARTKSPVHLLPDKLQSLVSVMYSWPGRQAGGKTTEDWDFRNAKHHLLHQDAVASRAVEFLDAARDVYRVDKDVGSILDKPITHRLLELVKTTIPAYGHARLCSELVLEQAHQQFKKWLVSDTHPDAHLSAMEKAVGRDWFWRLSSLHSLWRNGTERERNCAEVGLRRLVIGEIGVRVDLRSRAGELLQQYLRDALEQAMRSPVDEMLKDSQEDNAMCAGSREYIWEAYRRVDNHEMWGQRAAAVEDVVRSGLPDDVSPADLELCKRARFIRKSEGGNRRAYDYNVVQVGHAVSAIVAGAPNDVVASNRVNNARDGNGDRRYYAVFVILRNRRTTDVWVSCRELKPVCEGSNSAYSCVRNATRVLLLDSTCRRVGLVHKCDSTCTRNNGWAFPVHGKSVVDGGLYYVLSRSDGFPPFLG